MTNDEAPNPHPQEDTTDVRPRRKRHSKLIVFSVVGILLVVAAVAAWQFYGGEFTGSGNHSGAESKGDVYYCPMHKQYESDRPGNCPICSMKLVKKPSNSGGATSGGSTATDMANMPMADPSDTAASNDPAENAIFVSPEQQQLTGIRTEPVAVRQMVKEIRTSGKIGFDETKITHVHTKISGWIEQVFVEYVGKFVRRGDPLFTIYSPDLVATQEEYLLALRAQRELGNSSLEWVSKGSEDLLEATRRRLRLWDVSEAEIAALAKRGAARRELTVYSPSSGVVTERAAYHHGRYVTPELDLYTIVDLSKVWALGEIYEYELPLVRVGQKVTVDLPFQQAAAPLYGTITYVSPLLNPTTRTGQIRVELPNAGHELKPEMYVNVNLRIDLGHKISVPEDAVLNTGTLQYVFVDLGNGYFEPREVKLGALAGGFYAIQQGVKVGERVVTAANFILDSESRIKGVFANMGVPKKPSSIAGKAAQRLKIEFRTEPDPAKAGDNKVRVKVADAKGAPIVDGSVKVVVSMPAMGSMPPMKSEASLSHQGNGEYAGTLNIPLAWTWQAVVTVERGGTPLGSARFNVIAR